MCPSPWNECMFSTVQVIHSCSKGVYVASILKKEINLWFYLIRICSIFRHCRPWHSHWVFPLDVVGLAFSLVLHNCRCASILLWGGLSTFYQSCFFNRILGLRIFTVLKHPPLMGSSGLLVLVLKNRENVAWLNYYNDCWPCFPTVLPWSSLSFIFRIHCLSGKPKMQNKTKFYRSCLNKTAWVIKLNQGE